MFKKRVILNQFILTERNYCLFGNKIFINMIIFTVCILLKHLHGIRSLKPTLVSNGVCGHFFHFVK